ncbi:MAG: HipA domain-containing protein [Bacteroidales bacterium]|nr:HipA domain-containing protein [Bacteroidales bacterium]MCF8390000.1 HipA domain-containing protein [Bacteroidales bacterium]
MKKNRCLYCYQLIEGGENDFHRNCSRKIFGTEMPPLLPWSEDQMLQLAEKVIKSQTAVTGVQPKLSLEIEKISKNSGPKRFTIVGLWGNFILKPPSEVYENLPEVEDLTMHLAGISGIEVVPHSLVRLESGNLAYITRRIDRSKDQKIHMEDMCQLTERLTEHKYHGSYEQIGRAIIAFSENPVLDIVNYFEQVLFSFLTGNADMHLKNFSLIDKPGTGYVLSPAYDMVASSLVVSGDDEDLALTLNGKKKKIRRKDFIEAFRIFDVEPKSLENIFNKFQKSFSKWDEFIEISFLPEEMKKKYKKLIREKAIQLNMTAL